MIDLRLLIKNGVHFGHQTSRWSPKMEPYIWGYKNGIHLIDVMKTAMQLEKAAQFLESVASEGRTILLVGTKKAAQPSIRKTATELGIPFVMHRWVGGTFTNYRQVRKAISNLLNYEDILTKSNESHYTKKELNLLKKRAGRLDNIVGGIRNLTWPVGAVVVVDVKKENVVVKEARASGIPVVGLVDTNCDPSLIDYVIPGNDDSPRAVEVLMDYLGEAIARGQKVATGKPKKELEIVETILETLYEDELAEADVPGKAKKRPVKTKPKADDLEKEVTPKVSALVKERVQAPKEPIAKKAEVVAEEVSTKKPVVKTKTEKPAVSLADKAVPAHAEKTEKATKPAKAPAKKKAPVKAKKDTVQKVTTTKKTNPTAAEK